MIADIKNVPQLMKEQREQNKKDLYIELTNKLLGEEANITNDDERRAYVDILAETLEYMDFQIYEHYRSLQDMKALQENILASHTPVEEVKVVDELAKAREGRAEYLKVLKTGNRFVVIQLPDSGKYKTTQSFNVYVNGEKKALADTVVSTVYDLKPDTKYMIEVVAANGVYAKTEITTKYEFATIDVKETGAAGDGKQDDTTFIQAAILACPKNGRVYIPEGTYIIRSIFLKSDIFVEFAKGAHLLARTDREAFARFPGRIEGEDNKSEYLPGTWEGNPLPMFAGILTGYDVENVMVYGKGILDGGASKENWWNAPKVLNIAYRPRLFFIHGCKNIVLQGITLMNSPSWTMHPFFSDDLGFYNVTVKNPSDSPNTDGLDPESCKNVEIAGVKFSLGDDCIAIKSGKIYMGKTYKKPAENTYIHNCLMENGHGAVTVGSEIAGGCKNMMVENCDFSHTDRGLRIKTRRGRGEDSILDEITFKNIDMDNVMTPFVINSFYYCDPDGKTDYVQSREVFPVDDRTPVIKKLVFENIDAKACHVAATHFDGLPEKKIEEVVMKNVKVTYSDNPTEGVPAMSNGVDACTLKGIFARNVKKLILDNVSVEGQVGEKITLIGVDEVIGEC